MKYKKSYRAASNASNNNKKNKKVKLYSDGVGKGSGSGGGGNVAGRLGFYSVNELVDRLSRMYLLKPSKAFQRKVAVALKRGVDYGVLVKSRNKYRWDPDQWFRNLKKSSVRKRRKPTVRRRSKNSRKNNMMSPKKISKPPPTSPSNKRIDNKPKVPRPTVPPPPNFQQPPKILTREPFNKVIKHCDSSCYLYNS